MCVDCNSRRGPHCEPAAAVCGGAHGQGGGPVRAVRHDGQPHRGAGAVRPRRRGLTSRPDVQRATLTAVHPLNTQTALSYPLLTEDHLLFRMMLDRRTPRSCILPCLVPQVLLGDESHIFHYEAGGVSALGGCVMHTVCNSPHGFRANLLRYDRDCVHYDAVCDAAHYSRCTCSGP